MKTPSPHAEREGLQLILSSREESSHHLIRLGHGFATVNNGTPVFLAEIRGYVPINFLPTTPFYRGNLSGRLDPCMRALFWMGWTAHSSSHFVALFVAEICCILM